MITLHEKKLPRLRVLVVLVLLIYSYDFPHPEFDIPLHSLNPYYLSITSKLAQWFSKWGLGKHSQGSDVLFSYSSGNQSTIIKFITQRSYRHELNRYFIALIGKFSQ